MNIVVIKKLGIDKEDEAIELEVGEYATIWLKDGSCMAIEIQKIEDDKLIATDEDGDDITILFEEIEDIEEC